MHSRLGHVVSERRPFKVCAAGEGVAGREDIDISDHICLVTVITAEGDESAHAQAVRVEDLECFI